MTIYHLVAVIAALALPAVCMLSASCGTNLPQIIGLSLTVIGGVFGHAAKQSARRLKTKKGPKGASQQ